MTTPKRNVLARCIRCGQGRYEAGRCIPTAIDLFHPVQCALQIAVPPGAHVYVDALGMTVYEPKSRSTLDVDFTDHVAPTVATSGYVAKAPTAAEPRGYGYFCVPPGFGFCRGCGAMLLSKNYRVADGCHCNAPRGVNHGLVPQATCTCPICDPAQTGSTRYAWCDTPNPKCCGANANSAEHPTERYKDTWP